ncbi:hypothetical protein CASFOL_002393 [Castilleja foliolosa]|uniref:Uncharacterized protein n=1 Tax=Castilleja foliolosa TaxID=1961234 RepID=A0ABD3EED7_9LAMI
MRRRRGINRNVAVETLNAAATAIASLENRVPQASIRRRRWASCWSPYCCFGGSYKNTKRIGVFRPEPSRSPQPPPPIALPLTAPPSSPASFVPSEPHSSAPSPSGMLSLSSNMFSPIFATGPYAHETQLVSPPGFSTFGTEPSTGTSTPLLESAHLTAPSSPEVPFARLLEFRSYRFVCEKINGDTDTSEEAHTDGENERVDGGCENWSFIFPMVQMKS